MPNTIKDGHSGLALQVTEPVRDNAGLGKKDADGDATRLPKVFVYSVARLLLVIDANRVWIDNRAELATSAIEATKSVHCGEQVSVKIAGNSYQVQLPGCRAARFPLDQEAPTKSAPDVLVVHRRSTRRLAEDLTTLRREQRD